MRQQQAVQHLLFGDGVADLHRRGGRPRGRPRPRRPGPRPARGRARGRRPGAHGVRGAPGHLRGRGAHRGDLVLQAVFRKHGARRAERVCLDDVRAGGEVFGVNSLDDIWPDDGHVVDATFVLRGRL